MGGVREVDTKMAVAAMSRADTAAAARAHMLADSGPGLRRVERGKG